MKTQSFAMYGLFIALVLALPQTGLAQAGFDDDRVMLQGFYWESYRHGDADFPKFGAKKWYDIVRENANVIRDGGFDLVWLPPPSWAGSLLERIRATLATSGRSTS
jgi:alpha-amylase